MIRLQIVADSGSTHVPLWPGEHMKDHERGMSEMPLAGKGPYERWAFR